MPLSSVTTNVQEGGIGRRAPSNDKISGLMWWSDTLPAGFDTDDRVKKVYSLAEAEALGILDTVAAQQALHYHVSEYFRMQPEGELWIGVFAVPGGSYDFAELATLCDIAQGEIRQVGIYASLLDFAGAQCTAIQAIVEAQWAKGQRFSVLYAANFDNPTTWSGVTDLRTLSAEKVSVVISQDGGGDGAALFVSKAHSITTLGAHLGAVSKAKVQQSVGNPGNFDFSNGSECEVLALADGTLLSAVTNTLLGGLKDKGYTIMRKYAPRLGGSYSERVPTAVAATSDYAWLEYNRTIDKAIRVTETALTPYLQSNVRLKGDGTLREEVIGFFTDLVATGLIDMMAAGEISGDPSDIKQMVLIDPAQDVLETSTLVITIKIVPVGVAEFITVNIGLTVEL